MLLVNPNVFRAYDIRGRVDIDFDPDWVLEFGRACGTFFRSQGLRQCVVGHDCRLSSPGYADMLCRGLLGVGLDVTTLNMVPTPVFYYALKSLGRQAGVMITASHNPPEFNGFKVWYGQSTMHTKDIQRLYDLMRQDEFESGQGAYCELDIVPEYIKELSSQIQLSRPIKVVVDAGNGSGGPICVEVLRRTGAEVIPLYCEPDGTFPHHHPDPTSEDNLIDLKATVRREQADLGLGLDGDADRIGVIDAQGKTLYGDQLLAIFARQVLQERPGSSIIGEVKCSHLLYEDIKAHGGQPIMWKAGHSLIKAKMFETGAVLAGEMSGHMFFADRYYGFDDALYAALRLAEIIADSETPLGGLLTDWPKTYNTPEIRIPCPEEAKFELVAKALAVFKGQGYTINAVDGCRIEFNDGWGLVRASNTQAVLALRFEAQSQERLQAIRKLIEDPIRQWIAEFRTKTTAKRGSE